MSNDAARILIVSSQLDIATDYVIHALSNLGASFFRINTEDFPLNTRSSLDINKSNSPTWHWDNSSHVNSQINNVRAVWYRRHRLPRMPETIAEAHAEYCLRESEWFIKGSVLSISGLPNISWMSHPANIQMAESKIYQLTIARSVGFEIPTLFVRGGKLTRVRTDENGRPIVELLTVEHLRERLGRVARFVNQGKRVSVTIQTPLTVVQDLRARASWPFPALEAITETPTLRQDGSILVNAGYDPTTRLIYHPAKGFNMPHVPDKPTRTDVAHALKTIIDVLQDFPFLDDASRANVLALLLTPIIRAHVDLAPLALIDAPQAGTGKGLLTDVVSIIASGRPAAKNSPPRDDDELEKRITALLSEGATFVVFDDLAHVLRSPKLANALTATIWKGRMLGRSEMIEVPQRATWIVPGNNIQLGGDIARRCYWIRLDAKTSQPYRRDDFGHSNLLSYAKQRRGELLAALFTLARSWHCAGSPQSTVRPLGSFEEWTRITSGILEHAGVRGCLENANDLYEQADDETIQWEAFIEACGGQFGNSSVTTAELCLELNGINSQFAGLLPDFLADAKANGRGDFKKLLGQALSRRVDRRYGDDGWHVERAARDAHKKIAKWKFTKTKRKGDEG